MTRLLHRLRHDQRGIGLIEVLAASVITIVGSLGGLLVLDASGRTAYQAQRTEQAIAVAQRELETIKGMDYADVGLTALPAHGTGGVRDPNHWVSGTALTIAEEYRNLDSPALGTEELVSGGVVVPGPTPFDSGGTTGTIHRYVSWRDEPCTDAEAELCTGTQDNKRVTVAVVLDDTGDRQSKPFWVSTVVTDPEAGPGASEQRPDANPGAGAPVTAQPLFLYDTPCSEPARLDVLGTHPTRATGGTCEGSDPPDLMGAEAAPAPADPTVLVPRHDFSSDVARSDPAGLGLVRSGDHCPTTGAPAAVHRWATAPFATPFATPATGAQTSFNFWTRTLSGATADVTLCVRVHAAGAPGTALVAGSYRLTEWPAAPTPVAFTLDHVPYTLAAGDRLVLTVSLGGAAAGDVELRYDHPDDRTFMSVKTTTPLS